MQVAVALERTFSVCSGGVSPGAHSYGDPEERRYWEQKIHMKRKVVILSIITVFIVTGIVLLISVMHEESTVNIENLEEFNCNVTDVECLKQLCAYGWEWQSDLDHCAPREGNMKETVETVLCFNLI